MSEAVELIRRIMKLEGFRIMMESPKLYADMLAFLEKYSE